MLPISGLTNAIQNGAYQQRRGDVEVFVKTNHPALLENIATGSGPALDQAMNLANIAIPDRAARKTQMQGDLELYSQNLEALIVALMVYGS